MIDLDKYGLGYLKMKPVNTWTDDDFTKLFDSFVSDNSAPIVDISFNNQNIEALLALSHCRQCGNCCKTSAIDGNNPSIIAGQEELKAIAKKTNTTYEQLSAKLVKHPMKKDALCISLPCMFYADGQCQIYDVSPKVCNTYPLTGVMNEDVSYVAINLGCDYGRDIYKWLLKGA
ncbi:MAG: YkgJ family cysteine cluster protein [Chloroflexi bacterium]|nr:YkgJ family cysteine cluster protein [Chloroflexota bacterium]MBT7080870.1 YkgJ family cysteine cluster protein [Chloroflexota bacterium]MBT7290768.1 YkgJ family cysteine cluster protein [Chloroflexota bacterium]